MDLYKNFEISNATLLMTNYSYVSFEHWLIRSCSSPMHHVHSKLRLCTNGAISFWLVPWFHINPWFKVNHTKRVTSFRRTQNSSNPRSLNASTFGKGKVAFSRLHLHGTIICKTNAILGDFLLKSQYRLSRWSDVQINEHRPVYWSAYCSKQSLVVTALSKMRSIITIKKYKHNNNYHRVTPKGVCVPTVVM